jgi:hypothetical protein
MKLEREWAIEFLGWGIRPHPASIDYGGDETDADIGLPSAKRINGCGHNETRARGGDRVLGWGIRPRPASIDYGGDETDAISGLPAAKRTCFVKTQIRAIGEHKES